MHHVNAILFQVLVLCLYANWNNGLWCRATLDDSPGGSGSPVKVVRFDHRKPQLVGVGAHFEQVSLQIVTVILISGEDERRGRRVKEQADEVLSFFPIAEWRGSEGFAAHSPRVGCNVRPNKRRRHPDICERIRGKTFATEHET